MSTLSDRDQSGNPNPEEQGHDHYVARPSGHPDESNSFEDDSELHRQMLAGLEHEQSIDCGDDAVNADAAHAEARLRQAFPKQQAFTIVREQVRTVSTTRGAEFQVRWKVFVARELYASARTLDAAVAEVVAKAPSGDLPPTVLRLVPAERAG